MAPDFVRGRCHASWRETERAFGIAIRMRQHAEALPPSHPEHSGALAYLQGDGLLSLHSGPSKANVRLAPYAIRNRRRFPGTKRLLANTPLVQTPLAMERYQVRIAADGRLDVCYPINIERQQHWDGVAPTAKPSPVVYLPRLQEVGDDEYYVPAGWCIVGGDPNIPTPTPRRRMWVDSFAFQRDPVNNGDYLAFVQTLHEAGEDVLPHIPRLPAGNDGPTGHALCQQDEADVFVLPTDEHVLEWQAAHPVRWLNWVSANAFAQWWASRTDQPWQLPQEL
jgi:hypothetical protein